MEYTCPVCRHQGSAQADTSGRPFTRITCAHCKAILLLDSASGKVDHYKSGIKDSHIIDDDHRPDTETTQGVLSSSRTQKPEKDWPAIAVVGGVVFLLVLAAVYVLLRSDAGTAPLLDFFL